MDNTTPTPYEDLLDRILDEGTAEEDRTGTGTISLPFQQIRYNLQDGFPLITTKKLFTRGIIEELLWFIDGDTNEHTLRDKNVHFWKEWAPGNGELGPLYGKQLRHLESLSVPTDLDAPTNIATTTDGTSRPKRTDFTTEGADHTDPHLDIQLEVWGDIQDVICNTSNNYTLDASWLHFAQFQKDFTKIYGWNHKVDYPDDYRLSWQVKDLGNHISLDRVAFVDYESYLENLTGGVVGENADYVVRRSDQLLEVISDLRHIPHSRRHVISLWNTADLKAMELPTCHGSIIQFVVRDEKLSCSMYQRSADMFLGVPFNIASYSLLTHMIADVLGLDVGEFVWTGGDCHIYTNHIDQVCEQISREPRPYPKLEINHKDSILDYTVDDFTFTGYDPYPLIKGDVSV